MNHKSAFWLANSLILLGFFFIMNTGTANITLANDRMAGSGPTPRTAVKEKQQFSADDTQEKTNPKAGAEAPRTLDVNFKKLESQGYYAPGDPRSLGVDVWAGTKRSDLLAYLSASYNDLSYRSLVLLLKNALLTAADTTMIRNDEHASSGNDLTTLRIEKLMELGFYKEAAALYAKYPDEPYHERFARAGVLAMLYSNQLALSCLETQIVYERFKSVSFWQQMQRICNIILLKNAPKNKLPKIDDSVLESKVLKKLVSGSNYRLRVTNKNDLKDLTPLTIATLHAMGRIDVSDFNFKNTDDLPHHVISLLLDNKTMSEEGRFRLMIESAKRGLISSQDLEDYYVELGQELVGHDKTSLKEYANIHGWQRLPYLFSASGNVARGEEQQVILNQAIALEGEYGNAALWPFHDVFRALPADSLSDSLIRAGLRVFTATATPIPDDWADKWITMHKNLPVSYKHLDIVELTYLLNTDITLNKVLKPYEKQEDNEEKLSREQAIVKIIYEKLDKARKLHNYVPNVSYENNEGLTPTDDYVMPVVGLRERLAESNKDKRLGEIVLISSILLAPATPNTINGDILGQVLDSLKTVGLTKEAQSLANQVLLGFE